ncbi:uncharacterized protein LOC141721574 isoform X2 [Apium graveolens]|uniref:uncharacterized protein LOC141721574 isoform X2 n=1 Tax=Apium graveolens TaxID=4045 RepID=UPI003D7AACC8
MATSENNITNENYTTNTTCDPNNIDFDGDFTTITLESSHPLYLHPSDHHGQILVSTALNGDNFNELKRSMSLAFSAKNKLGFVTGKFKTPGMNSPYFDSWQRCNDMIITWILNAIVPEIRSSLVYVSLASDMWNYLHVRFTQNNGPKLFELKKELSELAQDTLSVSAYYTKFKKLYDDLLSVSNIPKCTCVCTCKARAEIEQYDEVLKVMQFLMGLNENFTNIRGQLLMMSHMPKLVQVLGLLQQDERQRGYSASSVPESAVLMAKQVFGNGNRFVKNENKKFGTAESKFTRFSGNKGNLECSYCHGTNHTKERCFHLVGFPPRSNKAQSANSGFSKFSGASDNRAVAQIQSGANAPSNGDNSSTEKDENLSNTLTAEQYQQLLTLLNQSQTSFNTIEPPQSGPYEENSGDW